MVLPWLLSSSLLGGPLLLLIPVVMPPLNHTSPPSMVATFLATRLMAVLQPSGYSIFYDRDTPIQLGLS